MDGSVSEIMAEQMAKAGILHMCNRVRNKAYMIGYEYLEDLENKNCKNFNIVEYSDEGILYEFEFQVWKPNKHPIDKEDEPLLVFNRFYKYDN